VKRLAALIGWFAGLLYLMAVVGTIAFVLYVGARTNQAP
jgi:hypothetical protein